MPVLESAGEPTQVSTRQAFRALSAGVFASGRISRKDSTFGCLSLRRNARPCMAQEHGRNTHCHLAQGHQRGTYGSLQALVSSRFDLGEAPVSDYAVCRKLGIHTLDIAQAVHRLLHLARVLQHGPGWLWSLIPSQAGTQWRECFFLDLEFMAAVLHDKLADPRDPRGQWQRWHAFILSFSVVLKRLVKSFASALVSCVLALL